MAELLLRDAEIAQVAASLELTLRTRRRNGHVPGAELRQVAAKIGAAVPLVATCLPAVLDAMGPEASARVRAQVTGSAGSKTRRRPVLLTVSEASSAAGVSARAVRAAAQAGRLTARKDRITGQWRIDPGDLAGWMGARNAA